MILDTIDDWELQDTDDIDARLLSISIAAKQQQDHDDADGQNWTQQATAIEETIESIDAREEEARIQREQQEAADRATRRLALEAERQTEHSIVGPPIDYDVAPKMGNTKMPQDNRDSCLQDAQMVGEYTNEHGNSILVMEVNVGRIGRTKLVNNDHDSRHRRRLGTLRH